MSTKMQKTVVVEVVKNTRHPRYGKVVPRTFRYKAHDEREECREGDLVQIDETRPYSKTKYFRVSEILTQAR